MIEAIDHLCDAIILPGPHVIFERRNLALFKKLAALEDKSAFYRVVWYLTEAGMPREDAIAIAAGNHYVDCACWRCVLRLHAEVTKRAARLRIEAEASARAQDHADLDAYTDRIRNAS